MLCSGPSPAPKAFYSSPVKREAQRSDSRENTAGRAFACTQPARFNLYHPINFHFLSCFFFPSLPVSLPLSLPPCFLPFPPFFFPDSCYSDPGFWESPRTPSLVLGGGAPRLHSCGKAQGPLTNQMGLRTTQGRCLNPCPIS